MGKMTLLVLVVLATPVRAETLRLSFEPSHSPPRVELAMQHAPQRVVPIDLSAFAEPRSHLFTPLGEPLVDGSHELPVLELHDNASRDWAADRDFDLAAVWNSISIAINHHVIDRNWDEVQISATFSRDL